MRALLAVREYGAFAFRAFARSRHGRTVARGSGTANLRNPENPVRSAFYWVKLPCPQKMRPGKGTIQAPKVIHGTGFAVNNLAFRLRCLLGFAAKQEKA